MSWRALTTQKSICRPQAQSPQPAYDNFKMLLQHTTSSPRTRHVFTTMDFLRAGESLMRTSRPLLPFLAPSAHRASRLGAVRGFSTSHLTQQADSSADEFSALLDSALGEGSPTTPTSRTSRFASRNAQQNNPPSRASANDALSSIDEIFDLLPTSNSSRSRSTRPPGAGQFQQQRQGRSSHSADAISRMLDSYSENNSISSGPPAVTSPQATNTPAPIKLNSTVGRTIPVNVARGMDVGRAFRMLDMQCARNKVRSDFMRQRFHERNGLKRKRLKSERWRRVFKEKFRGTIALVKRLSAQGW